MRFHGIEKHLIYLGRIVPLAQRIGSRRIAAPLRDLLDGVVGAEGLRGKGFFDVLTCDYHVAKIQRQTYQGELAHTSIKSSRLDADSTWGSESASRSRRSHCCRAERSASSWPAEKKRRTS